jgi:hypothetical protein
MSANRSVQAAQRRRAGPPEPAAPGRGPQPSINSSQMFAAGQQQQRMGPGSGQVSGRLAGQQAQQMQKNMMDQQQQIQPQSSSGLGGINKMTLAQAITLITLRLGKVETQLFNVLGSGSGSGSGSGFTGDDDHILVDKNVIQSLISRIDALEKKPTTSVSSAAPSQDIILLKQQFETIKPIVVQTKTTNNALKQQIEVLKSELTETKELVAVLQNLTMDNSNKLMTISSMYGMNSNSEEMFLEDGQEGDQEFIEDLDTDLVSEEIVGTNLKELIEQEFNSEA